MLLECLDSVARASERLGHRVEVIVVDNASDDGSAASVRSRHPAAVVIENGANLGFSPAVQQGINAARGEWLLTLNNDTTVADDALVRLHAVAEAAGARVGMLAAQMRFAGRPGIVNSAGLEIDGLGVATDRLLGTSVQDGGSAEPVPVLGASAGAAMYRREMLEDVGGFDTTFFAYLEDADLAWRAASAGWSALYVPTAVVWHHHSATSIHRSDVKLFLTGRNRVRMIAKNATGKMLVRYALLMVGYDLAYVCYIAVFQRSAAPIRGRLAGLLEWRRYRRLGAGRHDVRLMAPAGLRAALVRNRAWGHDT